MLIYFFLIQSFCFPQNDFDSSFRKKTVALTIGSVWPSSILGLAQIWYEKDQFSKFHVFDDSREWLGMDKLGHVYSVHHLSELSFEAFRWSGLSPKRSAVYGALLGFGYVGSLELLDGFGDEWGFSFSDIAANGLGSGLFLAQELLWKEQIIQTKFSYSETAFPRLNSSVLGKTPVQRFFKDYNGQTYWLSAPMNKITNLSFFPKWLNLAFGYSIDSKIYGSENVAIFNDNVYSAHSQFYLSLDLNLKALEIKKKWLRLVLSPLNWIKVPFPSLAFSKNGIKAHALYF